MADATLQLEGRWAGKYFLSLTLLDVMDRIRATIQRVDVSKDADDITQILLDAYVEAHEQKHGRPPLGLKRDPSARYGYVFPRFVQAKPKPFNLVHKRLSRR